MGLARVFRGPTARIPLGVMERVTNREVSPGITVEVRIGFAPLLGYCVVDRQDQAVSFEAGGSRPETRYTTGLRGACLGKAGDCYVEVFAYRDLEVAELPPLSPTEAREGALRHVQPQLLALGTDEALRHALDIGCAAVAFTFSAELVTELDSEHLVARWPGDALIQPAPSTLRFAPADFISEEAFTRMNSALGLALTQDSGTAAVLSSWLSQAWRTKDPVFRFLSFFIPIDGALAGIRPTRALERRPENEQDDAIRAQLALMEDRKLRRTLLSRFAYLTRPQNPPLTARFRTLVANESDCETLVESFSSLNKLRVDVVHALDPSARIRASEKEVLRQVQAIAERTVKLALSFGQERSGPT
jgi:hypothetical protein